ncbi:MAG: hypothetical protein NT030_05435 [Candidatus Saganbacteria bacterium]|nr:hypothetical protein [Candidatus Saganbacteria bacterium]
MKKTLLIILLILMLATPALGAIPLVLTYSGGTGYGRSMSDFSQYRWGYTYSYHNLQLGGDTVFGKMNSIIKFEARDQDAEISYLRLAFKGEGHEFVLGDNSAQLSDITIPYLAYQGLYLRSSLIPNLDLIMLGGTRGSKLWGEKVRHELRDLETFNAFKVMFYPVKRLNVNATFVAGGGGKSTTAFGAGYDVSDNIALLGELGSSNNNHAYTGGLRLKGGGLNIEGTYRDIEPDYETPVGIVNYRGHKGFYINASYNPSRYLQLSGKFNRYLNILSGDPDVENEDSTLNLRFSPSPTTNLTYSLWGNDRRGYIEGGMGNGSLIELRQSLDLVTKNTLYVRSQPSKYVNPDDPADGYETSRTTYGILINAGKVNIDLASEAKDQLASSTDTHTKTSSSIVGLYFPEYQIPMIPLSASLNARYRSDILPDEKIQGTIFGDLTLRYKPTPELSSYIVLRYSEVQAEEEEEASQNLTEVKFGLIYSFNTGVAVK